MELRKLQRIVIDAIEDVKGQDIQVFNTSELTDLFDRVIVVSGTSNRQTRAIAAHVRDKVKAAGGDVVSIEGEDTGEWVLIDLADIVVHVMQPAIRAYYNLEELWGGKAVRVKLAPGSRTAPVTPRTARPVSETLADEGPGDSAQAPRLRPTRARSQRARSPL